MSRLVLLFTIPLLVASFAHATDDGLESRMKAVTTAYALAEDNAADPVNPEQVFYQGAIPGLLRGLDPHSVFFDPGQFEQLKKMESSTQKGFGSVVSLLPGRVIVLQALPGTPSAKAGLSPGDEILAVNGYILARLDLDQLTELLAASRQRQVQLDVRRPGNSRVVHLVMVPEEMQSPSVDRAFLLSPGVGYIKVSSFDENTGRDVKAAIDKLGADQLTALVLDLRGNPGGVVGSALETASLFLSPGQKIFSVRGRGTPEKAEFVSPNAKPYGCKLAVLINAKTASAAEIVTGALQDHDRAVVLGEASYGKGLVQSVFPLSQGAGLALTTALYYTPSGRSIQRPLDSHFQLGGTTAHPNEQSDFTTDKGRKVTGGGGIQPDIAAGPERMNRLRAAMEASGSFTTFATRYLQVHQVTEQFEVTPQILDEFQVFLSERNIQPGVAEWLTERDYVSNRLKTEIFNQAFGVEKGDQVEAQRDPAIQRAVGEMGK